MIMMGGDSKKAVSAIVAGYGKGPAKRNEAAFNERAAEPPSGEDALMLEAASQAMKAAKEDDVKGFKNALYAFVKACEVYNGEEES